ncbi:MAG: efflux transporter outer membrane subunit [Phycisphaerae bacterium]
MKKLPFFFTALIFIGGCAVGPDYKAPESNVPAQWSKASLNDINDTSLQLGQWWDMFNDSTLSALIEKGTGNRELAAAASRVSQAQYRLAIAKGEYYPSIDAAAAYERAKASKNATGAMPGLTDPTNNHSIGLGLSWDIDLFGRNKRQVEQAMAELDAAREQYNNTLINLYADIATQYVELRAIDKRIEYAEENLRIQRETLNLTTTRFEADLVSQLDVTQASMNMHNTESMIPPLHASRTWAANRLCTLLGLRPGELDNMLNAQGSLPQAPQELLIGIPADIVRNRPDVLRAERLLAAQSARVGVATADLYPSLSITGNFLLQSTDIGDLGEWNSRAYSFGPSIGWNVFDGNRIRSNIELEKERTKEYLANYEQIVLAALAEVEGAVDAYVREREARSALADSVQSAKMSVELANSRYNAGLTDFQNVLDMQRSLSTQQDKLALSEGYVASNLIEVYRALGGGWTAEN